MQCDELIWKTIAFNFCSFKVKTETQNFCRNEYNLTGLCSRQSCPLANSSYATIREDRGELYLYIKTIERAHLPAQLWEKIKLDKSYPKALAQIDQELEYFSEFSIHKNKQRLTKLFQMLTRKRKLVLKVQKTLVGVNKKTDRRESTRERKAEKAARLEKSIEKELLERLKKGVYDGVINVGKEFDNVLDEMEHEIDEEEFEEEDEQDYEFEEDISDDEEQVDVSDDEEDLSNDSDSDVDEKPIKKRKHIKVEYEQEQEQELLKNW